MINNRIKLLRKKMLEKGIDFYIIPSFDPHQSEYVADRWKSREWISGFTGSAGTAIITLEKACLWVDGRYHVQAEKQIMGTEIELFKEGLIGVPSYIDWIIDVAKENQTIGFDGKVLSYKIYKNFLNKFEIKNLKLNHEFDFINEIWEDRPEIPMGNVMELDTKYSGKSRIEKISEIRNEMKKIGGSSYLIPNLDDIAWIFNIRGKDISYCPFVISYAFITMERAILFIDEKKLPSDLKKNILNDNIEIKPYDNLMKILAELDEKSIIFDPEFSSVSLINLVGKKVKKIEEGKIATCLKSVKNSTEILNLKNCQRKDGVAMVKFLKWIDESVVKGEVTEIEIENKLRKLRAEQELNMGESFNTIAAYKENAAMMHYSATPENFSVVKDEGLLLVDSGGQYLDGTTDITRTIAVGKLTDEEKLDYTLTLKSHIALSKAIFLKGVTGYYLDILARKPMWDRGMDYKCGTGHGVGFFLSVHEGPQNISYRKNDAVLKKGMVVTNEPGVYKAGKHGIRTENVILVVEDRTTEFGEFLKFETITYCPIDKRPILKEILTNEEIDWLNSYHKMVYDKLNSYLNEDEKKYLEEKTKAI